MIRFVSCEDHRRYAGRHRPIAGIQLALTHFMKTFDPYRVWLGISGNQRPPTYYQLLGLRPHEADPRAVQEAALRRTSQIRIYQTSAYVRECVQLLNEIAEAEAALVNPARRQQYDAVLQDKENKQANSRPAFAITPARFTRPGGFDALMAPFEGLVDEEPCARGGRSLSESSRLGPTLWAAAYLGCLIIGGVIGFWSAQ
jgi:hypothetical protein